jgi:diguanylate cyclase (GGDEF)-like protein
MTTLSGRDGTSTSRTQTGADAGPVHVLLVEDNAADVGLVRRLLASRTDPCFDLAVARNLSEALAHAHGDRCDVILLDLSLPDSRGVDGLQQLALALPRTPIVVLTGLDHEQVAVQALRHGAQDYLVKGNHDPSLLSRSICYAIERKAFEGILAERAHFDSLTGLVNRALFHDRLSHALAQAGRARKRLALMFIDVDRFKEVNDTHGHETGDSVLKAVADLLRGIARKSETVARLGGDEFTVIFEQVESSSDVAAIAQRVLRAFESPLAIGEAKIRVTCSLGVALFPDTASDAESLLRQADAAMFDAKKSGRNTVQVFGAIS